MRIYVFDSFTGDTVPLGDYVERRSRDDTYSPDYLTNDVIVSGHERWIKLYQAIDPEIAALRDELDSFALLTWFLIWLRGFPSVRWLPQIKEVIYAHALLRVGWRWLAPN